MTRILLTGGGTAGHVMPHIAMLPYYKEAGWDCIYVGGKGIERSIAEHNGIPFYQIQTGKLRRYFSIENFIDIFRIFLGFFQALLILIKVRPQIVFSKGGFVSVPVAYAAWILRIPVVTHESDFTPGLANKLMKPMCRLIFCAFPETLKLLKSVEVVEAGIPVRQSLLHGSAQKGNEICGFSGRKPTILFMGGSSGAERINKALEGILGRLLERFQVIHIAGKGKGSSFSHEDYKCFEFVSENLEHLLALADVVVSRSGANSIFELRALGKPMLLIPLEIASRGDQVDNAKSFEAKGWAKVLRETELSSEKLEHEIIELFEDSAKLKSSLIDVESKTKPIEIIMNNLRRLLHEND